MLNYKKIDRLLLGALRWVIAAIFVYHGWQKAAEPEAARAFFGSIGFPEIVGPIMGWVEVGLGALLFTGIWPKPAYGVSAIIMLVAIATVQAPVAYGKGLLLTAPLERDLLILFAALVLMRHEDCSPN